MNWIVRLVIVGIIVGIGFCGYTKFGPVISEKIEEFKTKMADDDEEGEPQDENNGIGKAIPEDMPPQPVYQWDFSVGMEELISGVPCTVYGDSQIVGIDDPNAPVGAALYLDGDGDYIDCGRDIQFGQDFTLNVLVNCLDVDKEFSNIIAKYETANKGPFCLAVNEGHANSWVISDSYHGSFEGGAVISPNTWHDITVTYENGEMWSYVDGVFDGHAEVGSLNVNEDTTTIGRQARLHDSDEEYTGYIGRITIYSGAMTPEEVANLAALNLQPRQVEAPQILMTVTAGSLNVRSEPSTDGGIVATLQSGEKVELLDDPANEWVYIRCIERNQEEGYVSSKYLSPVEGE